jgi:hypothetical protein
MSSPSLIFTPEGKGRGLFTEVADLGRIKIMNRIV